jgi:hypothetical protein
MRNSIVRAGKSGSIFGKFMGALIFAATIGVFSLAPAFAQDFHRGVEGYRGGDHHHEREWRERHEEHRGYYGGNVYAPPVVVYPPSAYQSPGVKFVFPIRIR